MSAETLRRAAALMRPRAEAARYWEMGKGDPRLLAWHVAVELEYDGSFDAAHATHIASWHPAVALAVADWLDREAELSETLQKHGARGVTGVREHPALAVARAYLGEAPP